ncbi:MAG: hypothetical protein QOH65_2190, partial [Methylobacteriaceae bacterium]|nr:hypothetical protein [Methylobacteriaceae bacterium]
MPATNEFQVNTVTTGVQNDATVAVLTSGNYVEAWIDTQTATLQARLFNSSGTPIINGTTATTGQFQVNDNNDAPANVAVSALPDGGFLVVSVRQQLSGPNAGQQTIDAYRFNAAGVVQGSFIPVSANGTNDAPSIPSVDVFADGSFVVVWENVNFTTPPNGTSEIFAQRFNALGQPVHQDGTTAGLQNFVVNSTTAGNQDSPDVTALSNGNFVVTWGSLTQDGDGSAGTFYRVYNSAGAQVHAETEVNTFTTGSQEFGSVAALTGGGFAISWSSSNEVSGSSSQDIYVRLFDASGNPTSAEILVNTVTAG